MSLTLLCQSVSFDVSDIRSIDEFIEHAQFHKEQYGDSFFVSKHYGFDKIAHSKNHQEEQNEHEKLSFQHRQHTNTHLVFLAIKTFEPTAVITADIKRTRIFYYKTPVSFQHLQGVFHPPQA